MIYQKIKNNKKINKKKVRCPRSHSIIVKIIIITKMLKKKLSNITWKINLLILVENNIKNKLKIKIRVNLRESKLNNIKMKLKIRIKEHLLHKINYIKFKKLIRILI